MGNGLRIDNNCNIQTVESKTSKRNANPQLRR